MIVDRLENAARYTSLHPLFERAFAWLLENQNKKLEAGRHDIEGESGELLHVMVNSGDGGGHKNLLEAHRRYVDIHLTLEGDEEIGWKNLSRCTQRKTEFEAAGDFELFTDAPEVWTALLPGTFAVYFPEDAHAPGCGQGAYRKYVVKVLVL